MLPLEARAELLSIVCDGLRKHSAFCGTCEGGAQCSLAQNMVAELMHKDVTVQKHGHLVHGYREYFASCSVCRSEIYLGMHHQYAYNGCPNCLAVLDEPEEEDSAHA